MPAPIELSAFAVNPQVSSLDFNTSAGGYQIWHNHMQTFQGFWKRVWVYDQSPISVSGVVSGGPLLSYSYIDIHVEEIVVENFEKDTWTSGTQFSQQVSMQSDSASGGWGTEGSFYTTRPGSIRKIFVTGDTEDTCETSWNTRSGYQVGEYDATLDTSGNLPGEFFDAVVLKAAIKCDRFKPSLLDM